jgi:hypothetical protein
MTNPSRSISTDIEIPISAPLKVLLFEFLFEGCETNDCRASLLNFSQIPHLYGIFPFPAHTVHSELSRYTTQSHYDSHKSVLSCFRTVHTNRYNFK